MHPGDVVANRFRIESIAGAGGMGTVYRAADLVAGGVVALKTLTGVGERDAARFAREAAVLAELTHPGIVRYVAHGFTAKHEHYIAMEWLDGETLHDRLQRGRLRVADAIMVCHRIADAIAAAHQRGVVHRDLKPMNLFLTGGELQRVKVLDFGIARPIHQAGLLTNTGTVVGTPGYMAPEQVRGETALDQRSDVFALGCVLYRCLTGTSAFAGDQALAVLAKILLEDVAPPSSLAPGIPPALDVLTLQMLAKQPGDRPADGRAAAEALGRLVDATLDGGADTARDGKPRSPSSDRDTRAAITGSEQRLVSVVLVSSSSEPAQLAITATAFGGRLQRIADGATLVLFAHAEVATDHAARAARCALALRDTMPGATLVVASGRAALERMLAGDVIDRAVGMVSAATAGQIVVDHATAGLLDERFALTDQGGVRILRGMRDAAEPARTLLGKATPIVGRDRELATLESLWAECVEEKLARVVLVTAPPGGGKSRVRQELVRRVLQRDERAELLIGRGDSLRAGSPFAMIADAIRRTAGVREGDEIETQRASLRERVQRSVPGADVDRVTCLLGEITGVPFPTEASEALRAARADPVAKGDAIRAAWVDWLAAECARHPVLLVLEDLHWGDRSSVDLVDTALREVGHAPLMVVALARPEIADLFPRLWHARSLQEIRLPQLTRKASERLVRDLLGTEVTPDTVEQIVDRSAGNAFFLEELIRAVHEGRGDQLPDSVLSMLQLRLDALGPDTKRVLRAASVFGEVFWHGGVAALIGGEPRTELAALVEQELVSVNPRSRLPNEGEYAFRHDLVREATYAMMSPGDRALAHRVAGEWLVAHGYSDAVALASHFARGEQVERATEQYLRAAEQALFGPDTDAALAHAVSGLANQPVGEIAARLNLVVAEARNWRGEHASAIDAADAVRDHAAAGSSLWFKATDELFYGAGRSGAMPRALSALHELTTGTPTRDAVLDQLRSVARAAIIMLRFGPPGVGVALVERVEELALRVNVDAGTVQRLHSIRALAARGRGDALACIVEHEHALRTYEVTHDLRELAFTCLSHGGCLAELGAPELGVDILRRGLAVSEKIGGSTVTPLLSFLLAMTLFDLGQPTEAEQLATQAVAQSAGSDRGTNGIARWLLGHMALATGDVDRARVELAEAVATLDPFPDYSAIALATSCVLHVRLGQLEVARRQIALARSRIRRQDGFEQGDAHIRLCEIEMLEAAGDTVAARAAIDQAIARLEERASRIQEPWRSRFLTRAEVAATLARR